MEKNIIGSKIVPLDEVKYLIGENIRKRTFTSNMTAKGRDNGRNEKIAYLNMFKASYILRNILTEMIEEYPESRDIQKYIDRRDLYDRMMSNIYEDILRVPSATEREVLFCRYLLGFNTPKLMEALAYEKRQIERYAVKALNSLEITWTETDESEWLSHFKGELKKPKSIEARSASKKRSRAWASGGIY